MQKQKRREHQRSGFEPLGYRIPVAVAVSGISRSGLYQLMAEGELDYSKVGARRIIPHGGPRGLAALIERNTVA